jgi:hypothetical protein
MKLLGCLSLVTLCAVSAAKPLPGQLTTYGEQSKYIAGNLYPAMNFTIYRDIDLCAALLQPEVKPPVH